MTIEENSSTLWADKTYQIPGLTFCTALKAMVVRYSQRPNHLLSMTSHPAEGHRRLEHNPSISWANADIEVANLSQGLRYRDKHLIQVI